MTKPAYVSTREILTSDGRNLAGEVWRTIPEFPKYQITQDGDIRNFRTNRILVETEHGTTGAFYYTLWKDNGKTYNRSYLKLLHSAWPELDEGWEDVPDFPGYQVNEAGQVRSKRWPDKLLPQADNGTYRLTRNGKRFTWNAHYHNKIRAEIVRETNSPTGKIDSDGPDKTAPDVLSTRNPGA